MVKITIQHVTVINRAIVFLEPLIRKVEDEKLATKIQGDIDHLNEIKLFLIDTITQPNLPFGLGLDPKQITPNPSGPGGT